MRAILDGRVPPGSPVPACRRLAKELNVARNTVVLAYQHLVDDGYLVSRERSGYYVNEDIFAGRIAGRRAPTTDQMFAPDWEERVGTTTSAQRNARVHRDWQSFPYPFVYGQLDLALFPIAQWRECTRQALSGGAMRRWATAGGNADDPALVEQIHTRVLPRRGVGATPDEILITLGAQHAIYLLATVILGKHCVVGMEEPGYPDARNVFALHSKRLESFAIDDSGLVPDDRLRGCDAVYLTPSHQYPTTVTMGMDRRNEILRRSIDEDFIIIEDDYESEYHFADAPPPALKSLDHGSRVLYIGSLSASLAPGLRLGYLVGPAPLIREARALRDLMVRHPPADNQYAAALFLSLGYHDALVRRLGNVLKERWQATREALDVHLPGSARSPTLGGTAYWVTGPDTLDARELEHVAAAQGILIEPGDANFTGTNPPSNYFRLGYSSIATEKIAPGIARLADLVRQCS